MAITNFTSLDFEDIKDTLKSYLRSNSAFTDYDYEGSTLSVIIDLLAYNTYIAAYNANMLSNEVFIDSATLRENVVSLARNIGYLPRPRTSSQARISFFIDTGDFSSAPRSITLKKGNVAVNTSNRSTGGFTYCVPDDITATIFQNRASFDDVTIYEGTLITEEFTVDSSIQNQRYILSNIGIDYNTIRVTVKDSFFSNDSITFKMATSITEIDGQSRVFFIQEVEDEKYEIIFGDGVFGRELVNDNVIEVSYITCNGAEPNGAASFKINGNFYDNNDNLIARNISDVILIEASRGGASIESAQSVKNYATRFYSSQGRAVTARDYETIVRSVYPETDSINAFGGEELDPPRFGKVFITIKPKSGLFLSNTLKDSIKKELRSYAVAGIVPEILDTKFLYVESDVTAYYNPSLAKDAYSVNQSISKTLEKFADSEEMNMHGSRFRYSKFTSLIDQSDRSITSNITEVRIRRDMRAILNRLAEYEVCFGNAFRIKNAGYNIKSSGFKVSGISKTVYFSDIPGTAGTTGELVLITIPEPTVSNTGTEDQVRSTAEIVRRNVGTVDYIKGEINISAINITSTEITKNQTIQISTIPRSNDIVGLQDLFLQFDTGESNINVIEDNILSGADPTGSRFISTPTNIDNNVIRPRL
tara:strand:+ start:574 stop:2517 length:1944 start_codon:yes stop_codon:yes gene_type:complete